ncbi:hypothetical protein F383_39403 [Gossypium arboreum]|uniref:Uncharacterized protein n=1 Tax=Gossypium arboreum TaxID=29729 RepID=A0A0B0MKE3_GOSAR|nr:hypothetical protein F383_39403 [Gossypium arboreum]
MPSYISRTRVQLNEFEHSHP